MPKLKTATLSLSGQQFTLSYGMEEYRDLSAQFDADIFKGSHWVSKFNLGTMEQVLWTLLQRANPISMEELTDLWGPVDLIAINDALCELIVEAKPSPLVPPDSAPSAVSTSA